MSAAGEWTDFVAAATTALQRDTRAALAPLSAESFLGHQHKRARRAPAETGWSTLHAIEALLQNTLHPRYAAQVRLHKVLLFAMAHRIFGDNYAAHLPRLQAYFSGDAPKRFVAVTMPRQEGKSQGTADFVAALLLCVPSITTCVWAVGQRNAALLVEKSLATLAHWRDAGLMPPDYRLLNKTGSEIRISIGGNVRVALALPATVNIAVTRNATRHPRGVQVQGGWGLDWTGLDNFGDRWNFLLHKWGRRGCALNTQRAGDGSGNSGGCARQGGGRRSRAR